MTELVTFAKQFGPILGVILYILFKERRSIIAFFTRRAETKEQVQAAYNGERRATIEKLIETQERQSGEWLKLFLVERNDRRTADQRVVDSLTMVEEMVTQAIETMKAFVDISRLTVDKSDAREAQTLELIRHVVEAIKESTRVNGAVGFVLSRLYFNGQQDKTFTDVLDAMETDGDGKG